MRLDSIVIGMDFSAPAIRGAKWVMEHVAPAAELTLVHVIDLPGRQRFAVELVPSPDEIERAARDFAEPELRRLAPFLSESVTHVEVRVGKPHEEIAHVARERNADLIVIGPHGERPRRSRFLGTTAERIVRTSAIPVLVATEPRDGPPRTFLVPVEDADITPLVLESTRDLAAIFDADITLLHVWSNAAYSHVASMAYATAPNDAHAESEIAKDLHTSAVHWLEELATKGIARDRVAAVVTYGEAGETIAQVAQSSDADLIIMGGRGSGLVLPALLGSTVGSVLHEARCPVLVVTEARRGA
jgi:nucleotide-binding universal stress UspA family protein